MIDASVYGMKTRPVEGQTKGELEHISKIIFRWYRSMPIAYKFQLQQGMSGLVCPDCEEGPDKCTCDNGVRLPNGK
jgi:hypothetical protein